MATTKKGKETTGITSSGYESDSGSDLEPYSQQYLDDLLEKATLAFENDSAQAQRTEEEVILLHLEDNSS
jgi:hypothetical protein